MWTIPKSRSALRAHPNSEGGGAVTDTMDESAQAVVEHLRSHAGEALQAVIVYDENRHRDLFRREDGHSLHDSSLERAVLEDIRADSPIRESADGGGREGRHLATVRLFEGRVLLHLPRDDTSGTLVMLDRAAASNLDEFVRDIRNDIYQE